MKKSFAGFFKNVLSQANKAQVHNPQSEEAYYEKLFVQNPNWNKPGPNSEEQLRWEIIEKFIYYIKGYRNNAGGEGHLQILDLGCGRGWLSKLLQRHGSVTAIEPVKPVAAYAHQLFPDMDIRNANAKQLIKEGHAATYDVVVSSEVIEHVPDDEKHEFISEINMLLRPGGFLIVTTPRKEAQANWLSYAQPDQPIEEWIDEATLGAYFNKANFKSHLLDRIAMSPRADALEIEIYQLWLVQKK